MEEVESSTTPEYEIYYPNFEPLYKYIDDPQQLRGWKNQFRLMSSEGRSNEYIEKWVRGLHKQFGPKFMGYEECDIFQNLYVWDPESTPINVDHKIDNCTNGCHPM